MSVSIMTTARELQSRVSDEIHVRLMWSDDGRLWVSMRDRKRGDEFSVDVRDRSRALDVFRHLFSYAAYYGVGTGSVSERSNPAISWAA